MIGEFLVIIFSVNFVKLGEKNKSMKKLLICCIQTYNLRTTVLKIFLNKVKVWLKCLKFNAIFSI